MVDPISFISFLAGLVPGVTKAMPEIIDALREHRPDLDLTPLGAGADAMDAAREAALLRSNDGS